MDMCARIKESLLKMRQLITQVLISMIISITIFYPLNPRYIIYMMIVIGIWFILLLNYQLTKNNRFFYSAIIFSTSNLIALILMKWLIHHTLHKNWVNITIFIIYVCGLILVAYICFRGKLGQGTYQVCDKEIFTGRRYDLKRIKKYIEAEDTVGINGVWGSGKSFIINQLKKELNRSGKYAFIDIDLLSCNLDELQNILLNEMEKVLHEHRIVPTHSAKLKQIFQGQGLYRYLQMLFMHDDMSYSEALNGFMQEISLLDETIIIVYEDIDRISDIDVVKKIFSISEKLASKHIKIIYQYEETNLSQLGLDRSYLEKYIPFTVNLTPIKFVEMLEVVLKEDKINREILKIEDFNCLTSSYLFINSHYLEKVLGINQLGYIQLDNIAIRKVNSFIKELVISLKEGSYVGRESKLVVINFYLLKHFFTELYDHFDLEKGLLGTIQFEYKKKKYTILELIAMGKIHNEDKWDTELSADDINALFEIAENKEKLFLLNLFEYNLEINDVDSNFNEIVNESVQSISKKASNEKKDRLIWNLLCSGKSEYTDYEVATYKFINNVLSKPIDQQKDAYNKFSEEMFNDKHEKKDNTTVFKIGIPQFISLSQALRGSDIADKNWSKFINFYLKYNSKDSIDIELILILNYCNLSKTEVYIDILKTFNRLQIIGNMNTEKSYRDFLKKYLAALSSLGYANTHELWRLDAPGNNTLEANAVENAMNHIKKEITRMLDIIDIDGIRFELEIIKAFMDKNIELVKSERVLKVKEPKVRSEMTSRYVHQEEFDRLVELQQAMGPEKFKDELQKSYKNNYISAYETYKLFEQGESE